MGGKCVDFRPAKDLDAQGHQKRRRKGVTPKQKLEDLSEAGKKLARHSLMEEFGCSSSTIYGTSRADAKLKDLFTKTRMLKGWPNGRHSENQSWTSWSVTFEWSS
ncbi:hypothetical protein GWK47_005038 [Chionoecetes opilio]|uniref:HTH psq-type domain-containing protein n=1 Tax=Chionoecetes opilio TaxID=41210 RepID=A0A8J5CXP1_CHIOP|nr:hypothetical protein GWK47_005038 [Chionoecetes opilio]